MANIKVVVNPILITNHIVIVVEAVNNLGAVVDSQAFAPPHTQRNVTFADLSPEMYRFFFWESSDGVALDTLLGSADIDGSLAFDQVVELFEFQVDGPGDNDPASGQNEYNNTDLAGADILTPGVTASGPVYTVFKGGLLVQTSTIENIATGGFRLLNADTFYEHEFWSVIKYSRTVATTVAANAVYPADLVTITDQVTALDTTHLNKELEFSGVFDTMTAQLMDLATVADKKYIVFNTERLTGNYLVLDFSAGGSLWFKGAELDIFWMAAGEELAIMVKGGKARVVSYNGNAGIRGRIVGDYKERIGHLPAIGTELTKAQAPGLYDFVEDLPPGVAVSFTQWGTSQVIAGETVYPWKGCFAIDAGTEKIKIPDLRDQSLRFLKLAADGERIVNNPGGYQHDAFRSHKHTGTYKQGKSDDNESGVSGFYLRTPGATGGSNYGTITADVGDTGGIETRGKNIGLIPLVIL